MNFAIAVTDNPEAQKLGKEIKKWLEDNNHLVRGSALKWKVCPDAVIVLGGDGFILEESARWWNNWNPPLIRVNFGRRGFLANVEPEEVFDRLNTFTHRKHIVQHRERISVSIPIGDGEKLVGNGLNDIVVERTTPRSILFHVEFNGDHREFMGDGVIFSTRTGSSGYNRSAGGPITEKNNRIIINPICPVDQAQWWMVGWSPYGAVPKSDRLDIKVYPTIGVARIVVDGREKEELMPGQIAYIKLDGTSRFVEFGDE